ncbi:efflux RND transporter permease subunit, partial [Candidatus Saccharibacteria bacterium]|nr:efflux RND transporter permease subunit [Candidatus Saccharibacteria bacterium]
MPKNTTERRGFLQRFTNYFFERKVLTAVLATALVGYGILSYTVLLKRDGFPAINVPYAVAQGTYAVNDPSKVDAAVAKPLSNYLLTRPEVKSVKATSEANFMVVIVQYNEGVDSEKVSA